MNNHIKTWLGEIVDETESMNQQYYEDYIEHFKKEGIIIDRIRNEIFRVNPTNKDVNENKTITEAIKQYYERMENFLENQYKIWKGEEEEKTNIKKAQPDGVPREPGGVSIKQKISLVLYELKNKDLEQFNLFCRTFS